METSASPIRSSLWSQDFFFFSNKIKMISLALTPSLPLFQPLFLLASPFPLFLPVHLMNDCHCSRSAPFSLFLLRLIPECLYTHLWKREARISLDILSPPAATFFLLFFASMLLERAANSHFLDFLAFTLLSGSMAIWLLPPCISLELPSSRSLTRIGQACLVFLHSVCYAPITPSASHSTFSRRALAYIGMCN